MTYETYVTREIGNFIWNGFADPAEKKALAEKYTETQAEQELTWLLYREMERVGRLSC